MNSMTGFGKSEVVKDNLHVLCEMKSVNQRFLDLQFKMPKECNELELTFRKFAQQELQRGRVEIFLQVNDEKDANKKVALNEELFIQLLSQLKEVEAKTNRDLTPSLGSLFQNTDFLTIEAANDYSEKLAPLAKEAFEKALFHLKETRYEEGIRMLSVLKQQQQEFTKVLDHLKTLNSAIEASHYERLKEKLAAFLKDQVEESRLLTEVALVVEKGDIHEELDRLTSHLEGMTSLLEKEEPIGRQLDFLVQEMNREVNTIGSKSQDIKIKADVVQMKTVLEKFREQIQNIE